jgi:putative ABC transport system permease protein
MIKNYFKIAWRNLRRDRQFSLLNLAGLSTGLVCALFIYLWINDERSVDRFHEKDSQLYQVMMNRQEADGIIETEHSTPGLLAEALIEEMPEVENAVSVIHATWFSDKGIISDGKTSIKAGPQFVGRDYFDVFTCDFIEGNKTQLFSDKRAIALSDELALKLFKSTTGCIGKVVEWNHGKFSGKYQVTGVFKKSPANTSYQFDILFNYELFKFLRPGTLNWGNSDPSTYVVLKEGSDLTRFNETSTQLLHAKVKSNNTFFARKYSAQHLYGRYENGILVGGRIEYVRLFSIIAIFILVIACINFMNLSTAKASRRMKEIGVKKVIGATRKTLITQYLGESILMAFLSLLIALVIAALLLPLFNQLTGKELSLDLGPGLLLPVLAITLITGIVSGSYPALYLSSFNAITVLKGKLHTSVSESVIRKGLVIFQFVISSILIVSVLVVHQQLKFIQTKNLGYNRDNIITFKADGQLNKDFQPFISEVRSIPGVMNATSFYHNLTGDHGGTSAVEWEGKQPGKGIEFENLEASYGLIELMNFKMAEGRSFSTAYGSDSAKIIFNEAAIEVMGLKDPVGKTIKLWGKDKQIIGVVKNFHFESLYEKIKPCFLQCSPAKENVLVKLAPASEKKTIEKIGSLYKTYNPGLVFDYRFLEEDYQAMYASEHRVTALSGYFAALAIIISCLGLFGLAAFTAQRRQKEIGIRKVVGASAKNISILLSAGFFKLVAISMLIAFPIAWWAMNSWLYGFAYRINVGAGVFLVAGICILFITLLTTGFQAIRAAMANPVKSLRTE